MFANGHTDPNTYFYFLNRNEVLNFIKQSIDDINEILPKTMSDVLNVITMNIVRSENEEFIRKIISCGDKYFEYYLPFDNCYFGLSEIFLKLVSEHCSNNIGTMSRQLLVYLKRFTKKSIELVHAKPNNLRNVVISKAVNFLSRMGYEISYPITIVEDLVQVYMG